jgi:uncharacterized phage infection (PIP) family protein YhgE
MESGTEQVNRGVETTTQAGHALSEIITAAQQVGDMVQQIATSAAQQSTATEQISDSIEQIVGSSDQTATSAQHSATACQGLADLALDLEQLLQRFRMTASDAGQSPSPTARSRKKPAPLQPNWEHDENPAAAHSQRDGEPTAARRR